MSGLQLKVTDAGRAALVNAANTGTLPVVVAQVALTATAFTADNLTGALPGELKRVSTIAGAAVADDTIHVTISDDSADVYSLRGFGLVLADGTMFAAYGQAAAIMEKSSLATLLLSTDVRFVDITATDIAFGDASFINPPATTSVQGVTEYATNDEALTGTDPTRSIVASALKYVLDSRFGAGAPSAFVKSLLTAATAAAFKLSLGIKSAAGFDTGAGNLLDADMVDGKHAADLQAWANLTGKPATFPPSAHSTAWADITGAPATATRFADWTEVTGKPLTFAPAPHSHDAGDIVSGAFNLARIPALPTSQTTGLDAALAALAPKASPTFTGNPTAPTPATADSDTTIATTAFVHAAIAAALVAYLPKNNPTFTGVMTGPAYNET